MQWLEERPQSCLIENWLSTHRVNGRYSTLNNFEPQQCHLALVIPSQTLPNLLVLCLRPFLHQFVRFAQYEFRGIFLLVLRLQG